MIEIIRYKPGLKNIWNEFVESSKNGTFLFNRAYMDYHSDRFQDFSLMMYRKDKLYCLFPANFDNNTVYSHQGLTYGGLILNKDCSAEGILEVFDALLRFLRERGVMKCIYKPVPHIYHKIPAEEDLYALFRHNALLTVRNVSSTIYQREKIQFSTLRKRMVKKACGLKIAVKESNDYKEFWKILSENLKERYKVSPVHTLEEIERLSALFPENIRLYCAYKEERMIGGVVCYITQNVLHIQYISANKEGKASGALDIVFQYLIDYYQHIPYFDFGISNEDKGRYLNESLIHQKEGFGGRAICYDTYELNII